MKDRISFAAPMGVMATLGLALSGSALPKPVPPEVAAELAQRDVIVILRDQLSSTPPVRRALGGRTAAIAASQSGLVAELQQAHTRPVTTFSTINAFATRVTQAEAAALAVHPLVQAVVADRQIKQQRRAKNSAASAGVGAAAAGTSTASTTSGLCGTLEPEALQLMQAAFLDPSTPQAQTILDGTGQPVIGKGVKVAFLADGLDPTVAGFVRPDGSSVFIDYQDFSGDPAGTATAGGEAFGDASSIAAQDLPRGKPLLFDISQFVSSAHPLPSPCNIRIRGVAPGASLVGLKVFSNLGFTTTSSFVQAIEYAVAHDDVDVINESFGGNPYPDTANDPISLANQAAVKAGVTVTVSTGDAGSAGTLGSPATDPYVIAAGASTQFRLYAQTTYAAGALAKGYASNNISSLSSGGFAQFAPRTVDVVAPGDLGWALCSTNIGLFNDCESDASTTTPIQAFGGTSEAAPLTAAEAALVIQAYRSTHHGADPSPALVKRIIMSTATNLNNPSSEQGAGLLNAFEAVNVALSVVDANGAPGPHGHGLLASVNSADLTDSPGARETQTFKITNTGSTARHLGASLETLGAPLAGATVEVDLAPASDPTFLNVDGAPRAYVERKFTVPAGADHLDVAIAYQVNLASSATPIVFLALFDPSGRQVAYNLPQGVESGYSRVDVGSPAGGTWTAVVFTHPSGTEAYAGAVQLTWGAEKFVNFGSVSPASFDLAPGATQAVTADFFMPAQPGDVAAAIHLTEAAADGFHNLPVLPVTLRTLIPVSSTGGSFTGTLTGGNGRSGAGPTQTFEFVVPAGVRNLSLALQTADNGYLLEGLLIDPNGTPLSVQPNLDPLGDTQYGLQLFRFDPQPGRWQFVLLQDYFSSGNQTSLPFTARIGFNAAQITTTGLPDSASIKLSASGKPVTATIDVVNTGAVTEAFFADARLATQEASALTLQAPSSSSPCTTFTTLPGLCASYVVPTETTRVQFTAKSNVPITMDAYNSAGFYVGVTGSPDLYAKPAGKDTVTASSSEPEIAYGAWYASPALVGPFGASGAPTAPVSTSAAVLAQPFDAAVAASSGDAWADLTLGTNTYAPLLLPSGTGGTITLTITPDPKQIGKTVKGFVYVDTYNGFAGTGDEVVRIPYEYSIDK